METLKRARRPVKNGANKRMEELEKLLKVKPLPKDRMNLVLGMMVQEQVSLTEVNLRILDTMAEENSSDADVDKEYDDIQEFNFKLNDVRTRVEKVLYVAEPVPGPAANVVNGSENGGGARGARGYKLPTIEIQTFSGELKDWLDYWAQFEKIDSDPLIHPTDKFNYLLQSLEVGTDAYAVVDAYHKTGKCYPNAVEALKRRYGNEDLLLQVYIREILKLVISNVNSNDKLPFGMLQLKLESHLRALKTLKLENADPATWLYPLVESSLPEDILLTWQRSPLSSHEGSKDDPPRNRLDMLMEFMDKEAEIQMKMKLARSGFGMETNGPRDPRKPKQSYSTPTLASCQAVESSTCHFCEKNHESKQCSIAKKWTMEKKRSLLKEKRVCFKCFKHGHLANACGAQVQCFVCKGKHYPVMCPNLGERRAESKPEGASSTQNSPAENMTGLVNQTCSKKVALQTLLVEAWNEDRSKSKKVRVFLDNGSQGSCILKSTAKELGLAVKKVETISHSLFGGTQTEEVEHEVFNLILKKPGTDYSCIVEVRDQLKICNLIPRVQDSSTGVMKELEKKGIQLSDVGEGCPPIDVLLGADVYGKLLTGEMILLPSGITAIQTKLGWTVCGKMEGVDEESLSMCVLSIAVTDASISQLWDLDLLGIRDETDVKSIVVQEEEDKQRFFEGLTRKEDGRYIVALPWIEIHPPLPSNYEVAKKRLQSTTRKLEEKGLFQAYSKLFQDWKNEGFIENVPVADNNEARNIHYIPHRAVIKMSSSTTPVRPIFDASCKVGKGYSLNECMKKGSNFIQLIPEVLLRFREKSIGFVSDIRKAFQMIEVKEEDRDCMRFIWWKDGTKQELVEYRHVRVMFGANCSPFILGAVLEYHLKNVNANDPDSVRR